MRDRLVQAVNDSMDFWVVTGPPVARPTPATLVANLEVGAWCDTKARDMLARCASGGSDAPIVEMPQ